MDKTKYEYTDINVFNSEAVIASDKLLLIDGDTIAYTACVNAEQITQLLPASFYTEEERQRIIEDFYPVNPEEDFPSEVKSSDIVVCKNNVMNKLNKILQSTGCSKHSIHLTLGRDCFRYKLYKDYKANRKALATPLYLMQVKYWMVEQLGATIHIDIEADDAVVYLKRKLGDDAIICAVDKDVLEAVPGKHFNYYESSKYDIDMKWHTTKELDAYLFPYRQAIIGDTSDNIIGIKGIGEKKVKTLIPDDCKNPMDALIAAYEQNGRTKEDAILNFKLCYMGAPEYVEPCIGDKFKNLEVAYEK